MKQLNLTTQFKHQLTFGGSLLKSGTHPKTARPLDSKRPIHLVLRADRSVMRLPRHFKRIDDNVHEIARKRGVRIYEFANVGNHLHLLIKLARRGSWNAFIRELTGAIARLTGAKWLHRPFTRVVAGWRKAYRAVKEYVRLNRLEAEHGLKRFEARVLLELRWLTPS